MQHHQQHSTTNHQFDDEELFVLLDETKKFDHEGNVIAFDTEIRNKIEEANAGLVGFVIEKFYKKRIQGIEDFLPDLQQEGKIGLMEAIPRFDRTKGFRFSTYATYWIKQAISSYLLENRNLLSVPTHVKVAYNKLTKQAVKEQITLKELLERKTNQELEITNKMEENLLSAIDAKNIVSLDIRRPEWNMESLGEKTSEQDMEGGVRSTTPDQGLENELLVKAVEHAFNTALDEREQMVLLLRFNII